MTEGLAKIIVVCGAAVGVLFWYYSYRLYARMKSLPAMVSASTPISGKDVNACMKDLVAFAASQGQAHIISKSQTTLELKLGASSFAFFFVKVLARFDAKGGQTVFSTVEDYKNVDKPFNLAMAIFVLLLAPLFVVGIPVALWLIVVPNTAPAVRWQVVQIVQIVNFIWEPFVIYFVHRRYRMLGQAFTDNVKAVIAA